MLTNCQTDRPTVRRLTSKHVVQVPRRDEESNAADICPLRAPPLALLSGGVAVDRHPVRQLDARLCRSARRRRRP
jgi:hypothetical protein